MARARALVYLLFPDFTSIQCLMLMRAVLLLALVGSVNQPGQAQSLSQEDFQVSGFIRGVAGYLTDDNARYLGYENEISASSQSLIGLQAEITLTPQWQFVAQYVGYTDDFMDSDLKWAYFNYRADDNWRLRLGKLRTPFFYYSDVSDVGFAYPYVLLPQVVYGVTRFDQMLGADVIMDVDLGQWRTQFEVYGGTYDGSYYTAETRFDVDSDYLWGVNATTGRGNFSARLTYYQTQLTFEQEGIGEFRQIIRDLGFNRSADALVPQGQFAIWQAGARWDTLDYFAHLELVKMRPEMPLIGNVNGHYLTLGLNKAAWTFYFTAGQSEYDKADVPQEIPLGLTPQLDQLNFAYNAVFDAIDNSDINTLSIGARWDVRHDVALKAQAIRLIGQQPGGATFNGVTPAFDNRASLILVSVDWVF